MNIKLSKQFRKEILTKEQRQAIKERVEKQNLEKALQILKERKERREKDEILKKIEEKEWEDWYSEMSCRATLSEMELGLP